MRGDWTRRQPEKLRRAHAGLFVLSESERARLVSAYRARGNMSARAREFGICRMTAWRYITRETRETREG